MLGMWLNFGSHTRLTTSGQSFPFTSHSSSYFHLFQFDIRTLNALYIRLEDLAIPDVNLAKNYIRALNAQSISFSQYNYTEPTDFPITLSCNILHI